MFVTVRNVKDPRNVTVQLAIRGTETTAEANLDLAQHNAHGFHLVHLGLDVDRGLMHIVNFSRQMDALDQMWLLLENRAQAAWQKAYGCGMASNQYDAVLNAFSALLKTMRTGHSVEHMIKRLEEEILREALRFIARQK
jgi:hypothetical protein